LTTFQYLTENNSKIILRVTKALADVSHKHIHLLDKSESSKVKREFLNYCGLPMIVGCIDCTHIRIRVSNMGPNLLKSSF